MTIKYRAGYKYQLAEDYALYVAIVPDQNVDTQFLNLTTDGWLLIHSGYAWDGATGAIDTDSMLRPSLVHDALCQLMRQEHLPPSCLNRVDEVFKELCLDNDMSNARVFIDQVGLALADGAYVDPANKKPVLTAP